MKSSSIIIGGDLCPFGRVAGALKNGDAAAVFNDLLPELEQADFTVVNLECPFVQHPSPILKAGPAYQADPTCIEGLKGAHVDAVNLANNHIMDHGSEALQLTIETCRSAGIACVGAGRNLSEANRLLIRQIADLRIAFLGMAEREFSIAGESSWGANPLDLIDFCRTVKATEGEYDRLIVLLHAGAELFPYPSPRLQKTCRFLVEQGASAVICQHSHCAGACEIYRNAPIVYGQGNLLHDIPGLPPSWYSGFLVRLIVDEGTPSFKLEFSPYHQSREQPGTMKMSADDEAEFRRQMDRRAAALADPDELARRWRAFCMTQKPMYFSYLRGHGRLLRRLNRRVHFTERLLSRDTLLVLLDLFRCDTHQEAIEAILMDAAFESGEQKTHCSRPPYPGAQL